MMAFGLHPKITGATLAGAVVGMIVAEGERRGYTINGTEAADLTVIVSFIVGYFVPNGDSAPAPQPAVAPIGGGTGTPTPPAPAPAVVVPPPQPAAPAIIVGPGAAG